MAYVTFEVMTHDGMPVQAPMDLKVDEVPRQGEIVWFFEYFATVRNVRHEFTKSTGWNGGAEQKIFVVLQTN